MKILIAGSGAVGTLVGGKLALSGVDVVFSSRHQDHCDWIGQHGIVFRENGREFRAGARAYSDLSRLFAKEESVALAIFAVKSFSTRSVLLNLTPYLHRIGDFITLENGLGNEEALFDYVNPSRIIAGAYTTACSLKEGGVAEAENEGGIALSRVSPGDSLSELRSVFRRAKFRVKLCSDWRSMKWSKLLLNIMANGTCAILDMSMSEVVENPTTFAIERRLILEAASVMEACKMKPIGLPGQPLPIYLWAIKHLPEKLLKRIFRHKMKTGRGGKPASLHLDFRQGKKETEWPFLYGVLRDKGREMGVRVPVLQTYCDLLDGISSGKISWDRFRRNPQALSDEISRVERSLRA